MCGTTATGRSRLDRRRTILSLDGTERATGTPFARVTGSSSDSAIPQLIDLLWWGRRFRLPIATLNDFFRSLLEDNTFYG
jgi:hypothetical protein